MRPLILVAAGGLGRETAELVRAGSDYELIGFLDDDPQIHGSTIDGVEVLGGVDALADHPGASVAVCAGRGCARYALTERLGLEPERFARLIHPTVHVPDSCAIGAGSIILAGCVLTARVWIGRHVVLMPNVVLTHDDVVSDLATVGAGSVLGGSVQVEERAYLGMACSVRQGVRIGADAVVGMGSVVLRDVPPRRTWFGVPARPAPAQA